MSYLDDLTPPHRALLTRYVTSYQRCAEITDPRLLALPHPKRVLIGEVGQHEMAFLEAVAPDYIQQIKAGNLSLDMGIGMLVHDYPDLVRGLFQNSREILDALVLRTLLYHHQVSIFQTTDALESMLQATDLGDDLPASLFQTPFRNIFIQFGETTPFPITLHDPSSGDHAIEGCYVFSGDIGTITDPERSVRGFRIMLFGSPSGKSCLYDDTFAHIAVPIHDETLPIGEIIQYAVDKFLAANLNVRNAHAYAEIGKHVAKVLLYMGLKDARQAVRNDASEAVRRLAAIKSTAKRIKAQRQMDRLYDRIVVGPVSSPIHRAPGTGHRTLHAHLRRGHFRMQPYGPKQALRRPQWIAPTLVGGAQSDCPPARPYIVRA
jgi:hypothetical protein